MRHIALSAMARVVHEAIRTEELIIVSVLWGDCSDIKKRVYDADRGRMV
jgi:hypothetical protein